MKFHIRLLILLLISINISFAQNIGQQGGAKINYKDINGNKQGRWKKDYANGKIAYDANFVNNKLVGSMKRYYENGKLMIDINYNKHSCGKAILYWDNSKKMAEGNYVNENVKDSVWNYYSTHEILLVTEQYKNGKLNGFSKKFYTNGNVVEEIEWLEGEKSGKWLKYYEDGKVMLKAKHQNGIRDGYYVIYHANGLVEIKGQYKNNMRSGKWEFYDFDGKLEKTIDYDKNGKPSNADEADREMYLYYENLQKESEKYMDPEDYLNNPDEYMRNGGKK